MAAGIPWSDDLLDGLLACVDRGGIDLPTLETRRERITGLINVHATKRAEKDDACSAQKYILVTVCLRARLHGGLGQPDFLDKRFPFDRNGLKQAIEWLQQNVNRLKRQGLCRTCLAYNEPPLKRLCVGRTGMCGVCVLAKAVRERTATFGLALGVAARARPSGGMNGASRAPP